MGVLGSYTDEQNGENLRNILKEAVIQLLSETKHKLIKAKKFPGKMQGLEYYSLPAIKGFGFGYYKNDSDKTIKVGLIDRRKHLEICK